MDSTSKIGIETIGAALILGVLGDLLLRATPWGLNALLWAGALSLAGYGLMHRWHAAQQKLAFGLGVALCLLGALYLGRDAALLKLSTTLGVLAALGLGMRRAQLTRYHTEKALTRAPGLVRTALHAFAGWPGFLIRQIDWQAVSSETNKETLAAAWRGLLIALPVLVLFGVLFVAADAVFERIVSQVFDLNPWRLGGHLVLILLFGWVTGGFLRGLLLEVAPPKAEEEATTAPTTLGLGTVEVVVVLGLVNLLFVAFVVVQLPYLFGGVAHVEATSGLTLAQYARRGFFELVLVAALALPLLYGLHTLFRPRRPAHQRLFRLLAGFQLALLVCILASAAQRMGLYAQTFGLTEMRLFVSAFLVWLALVLPWFALSVLRHREHRFVPGAAALAFTLLACLHVLNPDALIVRTNVARAVEGKPFDAVYAGRLSADAVPALLDALPHLSAVDQGHLAQQLMARWNQPAEDWRVWNRARQQARRQVQAAAPMLSRLEAQAPPRERQVRPARAASTN